MKIKMTDSPDTGMSQDIHCREVTWDELADYFEIGASEISGQDIIAP